MPKMKNHIQHGLTRRELLVLSAGGAAGLGLGGIGGWYLGHRQKETSNPDVVIVGADAAGIGAALALNKAGLTYTIVEADKRMGGRALTDTTSFVNSDGSVIPFDIGCAWIHNYDQKDKDGQLCNPMRKWAKELNFETGQQPHDLDLKALFYGSDRQSDDVLRQMGDVDENIEKQIKHLGELKKDIPVSDLIKDWCPPVDAVATYMGPMDEAVDLDHLSTLDLYHLAEYEPNHLVKKGYGALVQAIANYNQLSAVTGTPVTKIRHGGPHILVDTAGKCPGTITARAVIVTVSTGVMNSGAIKFEPPLDPNYQAAFFELPMGLLAKIPLQVPGMVHHANNWEAGDNILDERPSRRDETGKCCFPGERPGEQDIYFLAWPWDSDLMVGFVGGDFAWELSAAGEKAAVDFATQRLGDIFGSDMSKKVKKGLLTPWASNPLALGAYAAAMPGDYACRDIIKHSFNDRIFFAGEALAPDPDGMFGTCSGAYNSGMEVAKKVASALKPPTQRG